jgi:hypothetical protein
MCCSSRSSRVERLTSRIYAGDSKMPKLESERRTAKP